MADPKQPSILDAIVSGSYDPLGTGASVPGPLRAAVDTSTLGPEAPGWAAANSAAPAKGPSLGTQAELTAPSDAVEHPSVLDGGSWSSDGKTLTLPARTAENSSEPTTESSADNPGFLKKLGRAAAGAVGLEDPNSSPQASLGSKIGGTIGRIGAGLALAAGTPEQKQLAEEQLQVPLKLKQLENENLYRQAVVGNAANRNDITSRKNVADEAIKQQGVDQNYLKLNMVPDELHPGMHRPATPEETLANPFLQQNSEIRQAAIAAKNASANLQKARYDALTNPDSLTQKNIVAKLEEQERVAMAQLAVAGSRLHLQQQANDRQNQEMLLNYGQTPGASGAGAGPVAGAPGQAQAQPGGLSLANAPDLMLVNPATGLPIPLKMLSTMKPTMQEQNRADFAASAMHSADKIAQLVEQAKAQVGPFPGRVAELMAKAGLGDQFNQELQNYIRFTQSAATAAHTGRFSVPILDKMDKMIGPEMNPDQLTGAIDSIKGQMAPYADAGWKPTVWEYRAWLNGAGKTPSGKTNTPPPDASATANYKFPDGTIRPVTTDKIKKAEGLGAKKVQ